MVYIEIVLHGWTVCKDLSTINQLPGY